MLIGVTKYVTHKIEKSTDEIIEQIGERVYNEEKRRAKVYKFNDGFSQKDFERIVLECTKHIKKIQKVEVYMLTIRCEVLSQSERTRWWFSLDYNDYGKLTGKCYSKTENTKSRIPERLNNLIFEKIEPYIV